MAQNKDFDNTNRGTLFRNYDKDKMKNERDTSNWANAQGTLNVYGMEFWVSAWTKTIKKGEHKGDVMQQLSIKPKEDTQGEKLEEAIKQILNGGNPSAKNNLKNKKSKSADIPEEFDDMDDDLPF